MLNTQSLIRLHAVKPQRFTFFWSNESPFSNFHKASFQDEHRAYTCTEQYMMYQKAVLFADYETAKKILKLQYSNPHDYKKLGRQVKGFDQHIWEQHKVDIVRRGCELKFTQDNELCHALLATDGTILVEASPYDKIWGIKLAEDDPRAQDPRQWKGQNLLGFILTDIRDRIISGELA